MSSSPVLMFHISAGALALMSGAVALVLRKGSHRHRLAGTVFVIAMVSLTTSALYLALVRHELGNCLIASLTFYLVVTSWRTARRSDGSAGVFELGAVSVALALGAGLIVFGVEAVNSPAGTKDGHSGLKYLVFGLVALFSGAGDLRLLIRRGVLGPQRIARHLWRMAFALLIAANTLLQGQARLFPVGLRRAHALYVPIVLVIGATTYWIIRLLVFHGDRDPEAMHYVITRSGIRAGGTDSGTTRAVASPGARGPAAVASGSGATAVVAPSSVDRATPIRSR